MINHKSGIWMDGNISSNILLQNTTLLIFCISNDGNDIQTVR